MEQLKVFSMRIESDVVNEYSGIARQERVWSRSSIMAGVLKYVLKHADRKTLMRMVRDSYNSAIVSSEYIEIVKNQ